MITEDGKRVLSKYILGQAPAYATHIAIGCGAEPLDTTDSLPDVSTKKTLDFEMIRVPISSRGFVEENNETKISLIAELPSENRYEITEVGLWSAGNNSLAKGYDSRTIFDFQSNWQKHDISVSSIPIKTSLGTGGDILDDRDLVFRASSGDPVLQETDRKNRKEGPRFLNSAIFMRGDSSQITGADGSWASAPVVYEITNKELTDNVATLTTSRNHSFSIGTSVTVNGVDETFDGTFIVSDVSSNTAFSYALSASNVSSVSASGEVQVESTHIHLNSVNFDIGQNSPDDELVLAFSMVDRTAAGNGGVEYVKILIEFFRNEVSPEIGYAKKEVYVPGSQFYEIVGGTTYYNNYQTFRIPISDLITTQDFTSSQIRVARVFCFVGVNDGGEIVGSPDHYIALDGLRLDNISTENPLYKMVGYSPIQTSGAYPVIKYDNTNNYIEFRFALGVS